MVEKFKIRLKHFKETMSDCLLQVWHELSEEQREEAEDILVQAWQEEEKGLQFTESQILADFLTKQILYPCYDPVFKAVFLTDENYVLLKDLLMWTIFGGKKKIESLTVSLTEPIIEFFDDRAFRCDIVVVLDTQEKCNIEMQVVNHKGLTSRMVMQTSKLHVSQAKRALSFIKIKPTYSLWIMPFDFTELEGCYHSARLRYDDQNDKVMSHDLQLHFFEFSKQVGSLSLTGLDLWRQFFSMKTIEDFDALREKGGLMEVATENLVRLSNNCAFRRGILDDTLKELGRKIELGAYYEEGLEKGREEGLEKGLAMGEAKVALLILKYRNIIIGLDFTQILNRIVALGFQKATFVKEEAETAKDFDEFMEFISSME